MILHYIQELGSRVGNKKKVIKDMDGETVTQIFTKIVDWGCLLKSGLRIWNEDLGKISGLRIFIKDLKKEPILILVEIF